jgi:hypothetical protein
LRLHYAVLRRQHQFDCPLAPPHAGRTQSLALVRCAPALTRQSSQPAAGLLMPSAFSGMGAGFLERLGELAGAALSLQLPVALRPAGAG